MWDKAGQKLLSTCKYSLSYCICPSKQPSLAFLTAAYYNMLNSQFPVSDYSCEWTKAFPIASYFH